MRLLHLANLRGFCALGSPAAALLVTFASSPAHGAVPADYTGKPYQGMPSVIPGRVELANVDIGGAEVTYHADHNRMNSAQYEPISGNDYRPDETDLPNICKTNTANPDTWVTDGTIYPSADDKYWYYIGYAHAVDWVKITVDVKAAGKYYVSSNWASAGPKWALSIWFNDGQGTPDPMRPKDGVNKSGLIEMDGTSDYHKWKKYDHFATVDLSAGLQVMTFHLEKYDHLQYGFLQFDPVDGMTGLGGAGGGGTGGAAAGGAIGAGGSGGTTGGSGGTSGDPSQAGGTPSLAGAGGTTSSAGGPGAGAPGAAGTTGTGPGSVGNASSGDSGGCTLSGVSGKSSPSKRSLWLGAALAALAVLRRRARR